MLDVWTDINMTAWLGIVLYVVLDDGYKKFPLDFIQCVLPLSIQNSSINLKLLRLFGPHSGHYLVEQVEKCMDKFRITECVS